MLPRPRDAPRGLAGWVHAVDAEAGALRAAGLALVAFDFALATARATEDFVGAIGGLAHCSLGPSRDCKCIKFYRLVGFTMVFWDIRVLKS